MAEMACSTKHARAWRLGAASTPRAYTVEIGSVSSLQPCTYRSIFCVARSMHVQYAEICEKCHGCSLDSTLQTCWTHQQALLGCFSFSLPLVISCRNCRCSLLLQWLALLRQPGLHLNFRSGPGGRGCKSPQASLKGGHKVYVPCNFESTWCPVQQELDNVSIYIILLNVITTPQQLL